MQLKCVQQFSILHLLYCGLKDQPRLRHFCQIQYSDEDAFKGYKYFTLGVLSTLVIGKGLNLSLIVTGS